MALPAPPVFSEDLSPYLQLIKDAKNVHKSQSEHRIDTCDGYKFDSYASINADRDSYVEGHQQENGSKMEGLQSLVDRWLSQDPDLTTRSEIENMVRDGKQAELERCLGSHIAFGTAGLRGPMRAGYAHMNSVTVSRASQGLADYLLQTRASESKPTYQRSVVIGYDSRHNSTKFARLAAAAFLRKDIEVLWFDTEVHTPLVPFTVQRYKAAAGIMITASHNPRNDNGYKVYWNNGCQINRPHDSNISQAIEETDYVILDENLVDTHQLVQRVFPTAIRLYLDAIKTLVGPLGVDEDTEPFLYTPMHGVGLRFMQEVSNHLGFESMQVVAEQAKPDPDFPTVPFPNPEEQGALDLGTRDMERSGTRILLANDPDADRFSLVQAFEKGSSRQFTGNHIGILLASYVFDTYKGSNDRMVMLTTAVSSSMLAVMAKDLGFHAVETPTGFKWLGNAAQACRTVGGLDPVFAYEEAIGYMFPSVAWDKDGVTAAAVFLTAREYWRKQGLTPYQKLLQLYEKYGYFAEANTYIKVPSPTVTLRAFSDIRHWLRRTLDVKQFEFGSHQITRFRDLTYGYDSGTADRKPVLPVDASVQMITFWLGEKMRFTIRGSGTEPKIKIYAEARGSDDSAKELAEGMVYEVWKTWFNSDKTLVPAGREKYLDS